MTNAVKFTPEGGRVEVLVQRRGTRAAVTVTDTGVGIAPEFLPHVFETFRQGDGSTTRLVGGLGLGLTIVRQLVELHGGTVRADSDGEGGGTRATIEMPIPAIREEASAWLRRRTMAATAGARLDGLTILVVDDEADACEAVGQILQQHGASVLTATSAARALALMQQQRPDVLVSDLAMPETDGFALIRQVRALSAMVPAAALSAHPASEHRRRAEEAGYQLYLEKPVTADELTSKLAQLALDGRPGPH